MSKILITGHTGFVGRNICKAFDEKGIEWVGYSTSNHDTIRDEVNITQKMRGVDICIHLAALAGVRDGEKKPNEYLHTNVVGMQNVIDACKRNNVKHLISFSSSSVLGNQSPPNSEIDPMGPISVYGISKMTGEYLIQHSGLNASIIRPFTIYGEQGRPNQVIFKWINSIREGKPVPFFGDGSTKRGYTYVGDVIDLLFSIIDKVENGFLADTGCQVYNIGGIEMISLDDLLEIFKEVVGDFEVNRVALPNGDVAQNWADITKARNALGFDPQPNFKENVTRIIRSELNI